MTEIYFNVEYSLQSFVLEEENIIVERHRRNFRKSLFHARERAFDIAHGDREYLLQQNLANVPIDEYETQPFPIFPGNDEVAFHVAEPLSFVDALGSFGDHPLAVEDGLPCPLSPGRFEYACTMGLDLSSIHGFNVALDRGGRNVRNGFLDSAQSSPNGAW